MSEDKKLIVFIDDNAELRTIVSDILELKGFRAKIFDNFQSALRFLESCKPDLIISDLIGHDLINGIEFYIRHIMEKNLEFSIWSGTVNLLSEEGVRHFRLLLKDLPKDFYITFDEVKALKQGKIDLVIEDCTHNKKAVFPCFSNISTYS